VAAVIMVLLRHLYTLYTDSNMYGQSNAAEQPINPVEAKQTSVCEQPINEST